MIGHLLKKVSEVVIYIYTYTDINQADVHIQRKMNDMTLNNVLSEVK